MSEYLPDNYTHDKFIKNIDGKFHYHSQISKEGEIISEAVLVLKPNTRLSDVRIDTEECDRLVLKDALSKMSPVEQERITEEQLGEIVSLTFFAPVRFRTAARIRWLKEFPRDLVLKLIPEVEPGDFIEVLEGISVEENSILFDVEEVPLIAVVRVVELIMADSSEDAVWDIEYASDERRALLVVTRDHARVVDFEEIVKFYRDNNIRK